MTRSDLLVEIDAQKHPQKREEVHLKREADGDFEQNEIDDEGRLNAGRERRRKNPLNRSFLRGHDPQNFPKNTPQKPSNEDKKQ